MLGPDIVSASARVPAVQLEMRNLWVQTPVAQQLGLRDGQIVQAVAEVHDQRVRLWLKDFSFELPNGWVLKDGDKPFLRVSNNNGGWGFLIQAYPNGQAPAGAQSAGGLGLPNPSALNGSWQAAHNTNLGLLLTQPSGFESFSRLLERMSVTSWGGQNDVADLLRRLLQQRISMAQINPMSLKRVVSSQARSLENQLAGGSASVDDPKSLIRQILGKLEEETVDGVKKEDRRELETAARELESAQAQSAQKWLNGELSLHVVLPFIDHEPVDLHFKKPPRHPNQEEPPLTVDIHSRSRMLGEIWLNTTISQGTGVDLVMWALRGEVADLARQRATELGLELGAAGLTLQSFQIFNAARPLVRAGEASGTRGSVIDTQA